mmetsp:Transcript_61835/g.174262  ORF Transcript_61835/g.174262 Transcript_61835/m.174262 type:complete len:647 (+) Transcript_61835:158-2098(+)
MFLKKSRLACTHPSGAKAHVRLHGDHVRIALLPLPLPLLEGDVALLRVVVLLRLPDGRRVLLVCEAALRRRGRRRQGRRAGRHAQGAFAAGHAEVVAAHERHVGVAPVVPQLRRERLGVVRLEEVLPGEGLRRERRRLGPLAVGLQGDRGRHAAGARAERHDGAQVRPGGRVGHAAIAATAGVAAARAPLAVRQRGLELHDVGGWQGLPAQVLQQLLAADLVLRPQLLEEALQAVERHHAAAPARAAGREVPDQARSSLEVGVLRAAGDHGPDHALVRHLRIPLRGELAEEGRASGQGRAAVLGATAEEHRVHNAARRAPVPPGHLVHEAEGLRGLPRLEVQLHEDREGDVRGRHAGMQHVFEDQEALLDLVRLGAAVDEAVVHDLVALQAPGLELLRQRQGLVHLPRVAVALDQGAERDQVGLDAHLHHVLQEQGRRLQVAAAHAHIHQGVEGHEVARHALHPHLLVEVHRADEVAHFGETLDEGGVQHSVLVEPLQPHLLEDCHRLVEVPALDARVQHAAASDRIHAEAPAPHVVPNLEHSVDVARPAVGLDHGAVGDRGGRDAVFGHLAQGLLQFQHVPNMAEDIEQRVEHDFVDVLALLLDEAVHQTDAPAHPPLVARRLEALREDRDEVLVGAPPVGEQQL